MSLEGKHAKQHFDHFDPKTQFHPKCHLARFPSKPFISPKMSFSTLSNLLSHSYILKQKILLRIQHWYLNNNIKFNKYHQFMWNNDKTCQVIKMELTTTRGRFHSNAINDCKNLPNIWTISTGPCVVMPLSIKLCNKPNNIMHNAHTRLEIYGPLQIFIYRNCIWRYNKI